MAGCYFIEYLFFFFNIKEVNFSFFKEILLSFMTYIRYFSTTLTVQKKIQPKVVSRLLFYDLRFSTEIFQSFTLLS